MFHLNLSKVACYSVPARLSIFVLILLGLWLPFAALLYLIWGTNNTAVTILTMLVLYGEFIWLLRQWGKQVHHQSHPLQSHGLVKTRQNWLDLMKGLGIGLLCLFCLFLVENWLGWLSWRSPATLLPKVALEGLAVSLGVGFAEELLFRGWLVDELRWNYPLNASFWIGSSFYAALHFVKPWSEILRTLASFPGLLLLGLTLSWGRQVHNGRLGFSIGLHAGLVWGYYIINVGNLIRYSSQIPLWMTGIDNNPLAGAMGLLFLSLIAIGIQTLPKLKRDAARTQDGNL